MVLDSVKSFLVVGAVVLAFAIVLDCSLSVSFLSLALVAVLSISSYHHDRYWLLRRASGLRVDSLGRVVRSKCRMPPPPIIEGEDE